MWRHVNEHKTKPRITHKTHNSVQLRQFDTQRKHTPHNNRKWANVNLRRASLPNSSTTTTTTQSMQRVVVVKKCYHSDAAVAPGSIFSRHRRAHRMRHWNNDGGGSGVAGGCSRHGEHRKHWACRHHRWCREARSRRAPPLLRRRWRWLPLLPDRWCAPPRCD